MHDHLRKKPKHSGPPHRSRIQRPGDSYSVGSGISDDQESSLTSNEWALPASEPSQPRSYATQRDFESHKDTISHLYVDNKLTLRNVIKEMEQQHEFRATYISRSLMHIYCWQIDSSETEYKKKFREWGLRNSSSKNRKDKGSCEAVEENDKHDILRHTRLDEVADYKTDQEASDKPIVLPGGMSSNPLQSFGLCPHFLSLTLQLIYFPFAMTLMSKSGAKANSMMTKGAWRW